MCIVSFRDIPRFDLSRQMTQTDVILRDWQVLDRAWLIFNFSSRALLHHSFFCFFEFIFPTVPAMDLWFGCVGNSHLSWEGKLFFYVIVSYALYALCLVVNHLKYVTAWCMQIADSWEFARTTHFRVCIIYVGKICAIKKVLWKG